MSLFWKIFVSFSIAMTLTLIGAVFVSFRIAEQAFEESSSQDRGQLIRAAGLALEEGGETGLRRWLEDNRRPSNSSALLVIDAEGKELLGRPVSARFVQLIRQMSSNPDTSPRNYRPRRLMPRLIGPDSREYHLLFIPPPRTLFGVLDWPSTRFAVLLIAAAAAAITALFLARYLSAPIVQLQRASRELAAGQLDSRVGRPSNRRKDEVGALARDFDAMAEHLQELVNAKETLLRDISHELRSPLARIRVALALAERHSDERAKMELDRIENETEKLDQLVGQVMMLTRLRTQLDVRREAVSINELVTEIVGNARFEHPDCELSYSAESEGQMQGDPEELKSAIENVVRNSMIHGQGPGGVNVTLSESNGCVELRVVDSGPGIPEHDLERIFEPFYRTDQSRDHRHLGEGIGLAITSRIVERHGGRVRARNQAEGGLEIILSLPVDT